jgi:hypothetical protein
VSNLSLRTAFNLGQDSAVSAQQVFTNRVTEVEAFQNSRKALEDNLSSAELSPVTDRKAARKNVLVYYGIGGIGKTTLSRQIEQRFIKSPKSRKNAKRIAIRCDFAETASLDPESYILRLRAGFGHLANSWPAFDVAFGAYWGRAHPGERLDEFINRDSILSSVARTVGLSEQITSTVDDVLSSALPGVARAAHVLTSFLYRQAKNAIVNHQILKNCELLTALIEAEANTETLSYFPYLLAWDLNRLPPPHVRAIVLLDTFEEVTSRNTREVERWLQRSIYLMPNVLFVITTRNRLDWADLDRADELDYVGPQRWPHLHSGYVSGEPRQHLVGYLTTADAESYLTTTLTRDGCAVIESEIRERIIAASGGLPLYLDLAVTMYCDILAPGLPT